MKDEKHTLKVSRIFVKDDEVIVVCLLNAL